MRVWIAALIVAGLSGSALAGSNAEYRVLSDDRFDARRVVAVELVERARVGALQGIADEVKANDNKAYERTIVNFYLPSMSLGDGSWATVSYTPEPRTTVNGLSREEELAFIKKIRADKRDRIGSWLSSSKAIAGEVTVFREKGHKFVEWSLQNGLKSTDEVIETRTWRGRRFDIKSGSATYFLVNSQQDLEIRDSGGLIATAERILPGKNARRVLALKRAKSRLRASGDTVTRHRGVGQAVPAPVEVTVSHGNAHVGGQRVPAPQLAVREGELENDSAPVAKKRVAVVPHKPRNKQRSRRSASDVFLSNMLR